jgi:hypothetical protein
VDQNVTTFTSGRSAVNSELISYNLHVTGWLFLDAKFSYLDHDRDLFWLAKSQFTPCIAFRARLDAVDIVLLVPLFWPFQTRQNQSRGLPRSLPG